MEAHRGYLTWKLIKFKFFLSCAGPPYKKLRTTILNVSRNSTYFVCSVDSECRYMVSHWINKSQ